MQLFSMQLTDKENEMLSEAVELSGFRSKAELIRFLIREYMQEYYETYNCGFFVGKFLSGNEAETIYATDGAGFPLRDGGAESIVSHIVCDKDQVIAFVPSKKDAEKIATLLTNHTR